MMNIMSKILAGTSVGLASIALFLYISLGSSEKAVDNLLLNVAELSSRNSVLEQRLENCQKVHDAAVNASKKQTQILDNQQQNEQKTLELLSSIKNDISGDKINDENTQAPGGSSLSPDVVKLLSEHCASVRGEACPNP